MAACQARVGSGREVFEFEFDAAALAHPATRNLQIDPRLGLFEGRQHPPQGHETFGVFADASPDRWGRLLMRRRLERAQRAGQVGKAVRLRESDYLLGVHDAYRSGALRLRIDDAGDFLDNQLARQHRPSCSCGISKRPAWRWSAMRTTPRPRATTGCAC